MQVVHCSVLGQHWNALGGIWDGNRMLWDGTEIALGYTGMARVWHQDELGLCWDISGMHWECSNALEWIWGVLGWSWADTRIH